MWDHFLGWLDSHPGAASWAQGIGTALAGFLALAAGWLAYAGAKIQAKVSTSIFDRQIQQQKKALMAALHAELSNCQTQLYLDYLALRSKPEATPTTLPASPITTPIFDSVTKDVGQLSPDLAFHVVNVYAGIRSLNVEYSRALTSTSSWISQEETLRLAGLADMLSHSMNDVIEELAAETGINLPKTQFAPAFVTRP